MRARSLALSTTLVVCVLGSFMPHLAHAATVTNLGGTVFFRHVSVLWPSFTYAGVTKTKSALRPGDSIGFIADIASDSGAPLFEADLTNLAGPDITDASLVATSSTADPSLENYTMRIDPVAVYPSALTGAQTIDLYAYAPFSIGGATTTTIAIDAVAPTVALATTTVTMGANTLTLTMSGAVDGTGSRANAIVLEGDAYNSAGALLATGPDAHSFVSYGLAKLNDAIASSTNGSFTNVPVQIDASGLPLAQAAKLVVTLAVADQAGNIATTSATLSLTPPIPKLSSVLFIPGTEASRLYYRDANGKEHQVWEPSWKSDLLYLAMNADGASAYPLYTKDIIDSLEAHSPLEAQLASTFGYNLQVYGQFETFMNALVASSTINMHEWRAYPYDWRYDPIAVVNNGTRTELSDGSVQRAYLESVLEQMASSSATGKVTIVAHSNGGLVAKALLNKLQQEGKTNLIDQLIMVGTPQWGTPADIDVLLHGDGQSAGLGLIMNRSSARTITQELPDAYALLPSSAYFAHVASPVATFDSKGSISALFFAQYGLSITSIDALARFLEDTAGLDAQAGNPNSLRTPIALPAALVAQGAATHATLDGWTPPPGVAVTTIAGWGQETVSGLAYSTKETTDCNSLLAVVSPGVCRQAPYLEHQPILTQDGDNTVVSPSALGSVGQRLYFDTSAFATNGNPVIVHQDLTAAKPVQNKILKLLLGKRSSIPYIVETKPPNGDNPLMQISSHSPVNVVVTDSAGKQSGVVPLPGTDFSLIRQDIPGSAVQVFDDEEYVTLPQSGSYRVLAQGYATGTATIDVAAVFGGRASTTASLASLPVSTSTSIAFSVANGTPSDVSVDTNGDGTADLIVPTSALSDNPLAYVRYIEAVAKTMQLPRAFARELSLRLKAIEKVLMAKDRVKRELKRFPKFFAWHSPFADLQIAALKRSIEQAALIWSRANGNRERHTSREGHDKADQRGESRNHGRPPVLSIMQAQALLRMLNYLQSLL